MQRKAYVPGVAALLAALLAGCTGGSGDDGPTDDAKPGGAGTASAAAAAGPYRTLPEACGAVGQSTLDALLPGIQQIADEDSARRPTRARPTLTYDTDRKVGCRWKVEATDATDHLLVDFERVVSYDNAVSDDSQARGSSSRRRRRRPTCRRPAPPSSRHVRPHRGRQSAHRRLRRRASAVSSATPTARPRASVAPSGVGLRHGPRPTSSPALLDDLGDEAFLDDVLSSSGSTAQQRTVTVAFRTSNVIVTIEYEEQPTTIGVVPDSKEMQDKARKLASQLAESLSG